MTKCNCFEKSLEQVKKHVLDHIGAVTEFEAEWVGSSFFLDGKDHVPVNPKVKYEYRGLKKDKTPKANKTKDEITLMARYCPFCGIDTQAE